MSDKITFFTQQILNGQLKNKLSKQHYEMITDFERVDVFDKTGGVYKDAVYYRTTIIKHHSKTEWELTVRYCFKSMYMTLKQKMRLSIGVDVRFIKMIHSIEDSITLEYDYRVVGSSTIKFMSPGKKEYFNIKNNKNKTNENLSK